MVPFMSPDYFALPFKKDRSSVLSSSTRYEELTDVGYNSQQERLEAVVCVYPSFMAGTDSCNTESHEYVRFYLSSDKGVSWQDYGMTSFRIHDIHKRPTESGQMEYVASLKIDPRRKPCLFDPLIRLRAILSWNNPPPKDAPNWVPAWGNVLEKTIQLEPRRYVFSSEFIDTILASRPRVKKIIDFDFPIPARRKAFTVAELAMRYSGKDVPLHRFAFKEIPAIMAAKAQGRNDLIEAILPGITSDPGLLENLSAHAHGNTYYEELKSIGLDPNRPDTLVGVIQIKKSVGYSGGPFTDGSREYVTFWADLNGNGCFEMCLGTAQAQVYDLPTVSPQGVNYTVRLRMSDIVFLHASQSELKNIRIRANLSWNVVASGTDPHHVSVWGNSMEATIPIIPITHLPIDKIKRADDISTGKMKDVLLAVRRGFDSDFKGIHLSNFKEDRLDSDVGYCAYPQEMVFRNLLSPNHHLS